MTRKAELESVNADEVVNLDEVVNVDEVEASAEPKSAPRRKGLMAKAIKGSKAGKRSAADVRWQALRAQARKVWSELTDDDFKQAYGSKENLYGIIQRKLGGTEEAIRAKLEEPFGPAM